MIAFPGSKINLGLRIVKKLQTGYHALESIFIPLKFTDVLEAVEGDKTEFHYSGIPIPGHSHNNLIRKVYSRMAGEFSIPPMQVFLHKVVPAGGGLGGGSADATAMLGMIDKLAGLKLPDERLRKIAGEFGADCPFFVLNRPAFVTGTGDVFEPVELPLKGVCIVLVSPGIHIATSEAFANVTPGEPETVLKKIVQDYPPEHWKGRIINDFEKYIFKKHPGIGKVKEQLYDAGAFYASMTGSGSTVYGLFKPGVSLPAGISGGKIIYSGVL